MTLQESSVFNSRTAHDFFLQHELDSHLIEHGVKLNNHFDIVAPNPCPELGVWNGPLLLDAMEFIQLRVETFELLLQQLPSLVAQLEQKYMIINLKQNLENVCRVVLLRPDEASSLPCLRASGYSK